MGHQWFWILQDDSPPFIWWLKTLSVSSWKALQAPLVAALLKLRNPFPLLGKNVQKVHSPATVHFQSVLILDNRMTSILHSFIDKFYKTNEQQKEDTVT